MSAVSIPKSALLAFAGLDAPPYQSGSIDVRSRSISKQGSAKLIRTLFLVMSVILQNSHVDKLIYQYMGKEFRRQALQGLRNGLHQHVPPMVLRYRESLPGTVRRRLITFLIPVGWPPSQNRDAQRPVCHTQFHLLKSFQIWARLLVGLCLCCENCILVMFAGGQQ